MARKLEKFPTDLLSRTTSTYPWHEWLDGDPWELEYGVDYVIKSKSLRTTAQQAARSRHGRLRCVELDDGKRMIIQFLPHQSAPAAPAPARPAPRQTRPDDGGKAARIREWAKHNGFPGLSDHGRLPGEVIQAYERAQRNPPGVVRPFPPQPR